MTDFRFIHAADIHLDSPMVGLARFDGAPVERLRRATREALSNLVDRALDEPVDFIIIAGDLFDGHWRDMGTGLHFAREMGRLAQAGIRAYVLKGNHDAANKVTSQIQWPDTVSVFSHRKAQTFRIDELNVALHGHSFREAATTDNLAVNYPSPVDGSFNIGVLHTALAGYAAHANYAPCSLDDLRARGYDYWALGHVHQFEVLSETPLVLFPGNLQGRHVRETGAKGAVLVTVASGRCRYERLSLDVLRWHQLEVDASDAHSLEDALRQARTALDEHCVSDDGRLHAVRVTFTGRSAAHAALTRSASALREQMLGVAAGLAGESIWIEKVVARTTPALGAAELAAREDAVAEFAAHFERLRTDDTFLKLIEDDLARLLGQLPADAIEQAEELQLLSEGRFDELLERLAPDLLSRLQGGGA